MKPISYPIPHITQGESECVQTSAAQILAYYSIRKTIDEIKNEVPILFSKNRKSLGTSLAHIAQYFIDLGGRQGRSDVDACDRYFRLS